MRPYLTPVRVCGLLLFAGFGTSARVAAAQEVFQDVEYISGHANMENKEKGMLLIGESELRFTKNNGDVLFAIPLSAVTEVSSQVEVRDGSVGKKLLFGGLAGSRKQDFVQVSYETDKLAEGLVFKVKQGKSTGIVAKLKFAAKKTKGQSPTTSPAPTTSSKVAPSTVPYQTN